MSSLEQRIDQFFEVDLPQALAGLGSTLGRAKAWRAALYDAGLGGLGYPDTIGGHGGSADDVATWARCSAGRVPREEALFGIGIGMALPTIRDHASVELQRRFVASGLRGDEIWCQLYSEPGAGSDLAALSTRAVRDGDEWVIDGQKVWTSGAQHSDLGILLARTDPDAPARQGITMIVLPMRQRGVEVRPLRQMTGEAEFNEVFMSGARAPIDWVIGQVNGGWAMALALLGHERVQTGVSSVGQLGTERTKSGRNPLPFSQLVELARDHDRVGEPAIRQELARVYTGEVVIAALRARGVHPSIGKLWRTRQGRLAADLAARLAFPAGPAWTPDDVDADYWNHHILNCRAMSIGGGTDEIQRNTLGERGLGLPREPSPAR